MRRLVARTDMVERELNPGERQQQWWGKPWGSATAAVYLHGPAESSGDQSKLTGKGKGNGRRKGTKNDASAGAVAPPAPTS